MAVGSIKVFGPRVAATLLRIFEEQRDDVCAEVLRSAQATVSFVRWEGWNGETAVHELVLAIPPVLFARLEDQLKSIEARLESKLDRLAVGSDVEVLRTAVALTELLEGTGLGFQFLNERTVRIFPLPTTTPAAEVTATAGLRYAHDVQSFESVSTGAVYPANLSMFNTPTIYDSGHFSESAPSWRLAATYHFTPDVMLYGQVATGFFRGASQGTNPGDLPPMPGNTLTNYESGLKAQFLEGRGLVDVTVFHVRWPDISIGSASGWTNGAHATSRGFELTSSYAFSQGLRLAYNAAYTRAAHDSVIPAAAVFLTGYQLNNVPAWGMSGNAEYSWDLEDLWQARVGGTARWINSQFTLTPCKVGPLPGIRDSPYLGTRSSTCTAAWRGGPSLRDCSYEISQTSARI